MNNTKLSNVLLYPQDLSLPKGYRPNISSASKILAVNCFVYWEEHSFPNCCNFHKQRVLDGNIDISAWENSGKHLFQAITYTLFFVNQATRNEEGLAQIKTYISSILFSFGSHSPILDKYIEWTVDVLKKQESNHDPAFLKEVIEYLETLAESKEGTFEQLAEAERTFNRWLDNLPEDLISKEVQENLFLVFFRGIIKSINEVDEFNSVRNLELNSLDQFLEYLLEITNSILDKIWQSIAQGNVDETIRATSIINKNKTNAEINLAIKNYSNKEKNYLTIIQKWGDIVSKFIDREIEWKKSLLTLQALEQKTVLKNTSKPVRPIGPSFPELFRDPSYYDKFIELLTRLKLIDENLVWIGDDKNKMIAVFWGLLNVKKSGRSIFISGPPKPTPYARKIYEHFEINQTALCSERYLRDYQKHKKVTFSMKNQLTRELELAFFPNYN